MDYRRGHLTDELLVNRHFTLSHHLIQLLVVFFAFKHIIEIGQVFGGWRPFMVRVDFALDFGKPNKLVREQNALRSEIYEELLNQLSLPAAQALHNLRQVEDYLF
jgi:hypothetical protein